MKKKKDAANETKKSQGVGFLKSATKFSKVNAKFSKVNVKF